MANRFLSSIKLETLTAATVDTDKFLVSDGGVIKFRTGTQVLSDIGGQASLTNPITGSGTTNYVSKFTGANSLGDSLVYDNGTNIGIGTTSPNAKLQVNDNVRIGNTSTGVRFYIQGVDEFRADALDVAGNGWNSLHLRADGTDGLFLQKDTNNVGIGTTSPSSKLDVRGDISITNANGGNPTDAGSLYFTEAAGVWGSTQYGFRINQQGTSNYLNFQSANTTTVRDILTLARDTGNVGIGTTSPSSELDVYGTISLNGFDGLRYDTTSQSLYAGHLAGNNQTGSNAFGYYALQNNTGNSSNGFGYFALQNNTGINSNGFGYYALNNNTGINSNGFGFYALRYNTGNNSNAFGYATLSNNTGDSSNGFGHVALRNNTGVSSNGFGYFALTNNTGDNSNGFGHVALENNTGVNSNGFGNYALRYNTGDNSNGFGHVALQNNTGVGSNGFGFYALSNNTGNNSNGFGHVALRYNQGDNNTAIGHTAGYETSALTGTDNTFLGYNASYGANTTITNSTAVGANVTLTDSNTVILGNGANVGIGTTSPSYKLDVNGDARLNGVTFVASGATRSISSHSPAGQLQLNGGTSSSNGAFINITGDGYGSGDFVNIQAGTTSIVGDLIVSKTAPGSSEIVNVDTVTPLIQTGDINGYWSSDSVITHDVANRILSMAKTNVGIGVVTPTVPLEVLGNIKATRYINVINTLTSNYYHSANNPASWYYMPFNTLGEGTGNQYYNNYAAIYDGIVRKVLIKQVNTGTAPTATSTNIRVSRNGSVIWTGTAQASSGYSMYVSWTLGDSDATFSEGDRVQVAFNTNGLWYNVTASIIIEYTE